MQDYLSTRVNLSSPETVIAYDELPLWSAIFGLMLLKHLKLRGKIKVLDVGCGTGFPLLELAQRLGATSTVYGIDPWEDALGRAKFKAQVWGLQNVEFRCGDATSLPFADGHFDLIVSNLGVNNFGDPPAALAEFRRVSKPGAKIALTTNLKGHMGEFYDVYESTLVELGKTKAIAALREHVAKRATVAGLTTLFERSGFRTSGVYEESTTMSFADGSAFLRHHFIRLGFLEGWREIIEMEEEMEVFSRLEANLNDLAEIKGSLELTIPMGYVEGERIT